jgi:peptidylprolyl isomerase
VAEKRSKPGRESPSKVTPNKGARKMVVKKGDRVKVQYTGTLDDGTIFDKSEEGDPLEFTVGSGQIISGFDNAVGGMSLNEEKRVTIKPEDAYGQRDEALIKEFLRSSLSFTPEKGMVIRLKDQTGRSIPGTITYVTETGIVVDFNHPLAGKDLTFNIKVVAIE